MVTLGVVTLGSGLSDNFHFGGEVYSQPNQNSKCQDLPKFQFSGGGGGTLSQVKTQSAKICLNSNFQGGGLLYCSESGALSEF